MDTDDLTRDAYQVLIVHSGAVSEFLRAEIGAAASRYSSEDPYLDVMYQFVSKRSQNPESYLDYWNLLDETDPREFGIQLSELAEGTMAVIKTPIDKRGPVFE